MKTIVLTDKLYEKLVDVLEVHDDCGHRGYGWQSDELMELLEVVRESKN